MIDDVIQESRAVIDNFDFYQINAIALKVPRRDDYLLISLTLHRFEGVADQVIEDLAHPPRIGLYDRQFRIDVELQRQRLFRVTIQIRDLSNQLIQVEPSHSHFRRTGVFAEGVYHLLHRRHLLNNRMCGAVQEFGIGVVSPEITTAKTLRGQLNRGQRVFDFMSEPACHLAPGSIALGLQQSSDIVEYDDVASRILTLPGQRRTGAHQDSSPHLPT